MKILVDADACPVKEIIVKVARRYHIPVTMLIDTSHELEEGYSSVITVDKARDSVDIALINLVKAGDIVVTQDYGVAAMALGKKARVVNQNGMIYTDSNIDKLLFERHLGQKMRRAGKKAGGKAINAKKRVKADDENFERVFCTLVDDAVSG